LILARLFKGAEWLAKYPIAYYVGYGAGYTIMIKLHSDILTQLTATVESLPKIYYHGWDSIQYLGFVQYFGGNGFIPLLSYLFFRRAQGICHEECHKNWYLGSHDYLWCPIWIYDYGKDFFADWSHAIFIGRLVRIDSISG
jgi:hypothetical protein